MGITKRCFSPDVSDSDDTCDGKRDEALGALPRSVLPGQLDIRIFLSIPSGHRLNSKFAQKGHVRERRSGIDESFTSNGGNSEASCSTLPLLKLSGQTDIRALFTPAACGERVVGSSNDDPIEQIAEIENTTVDRHHNAYAADEEAAIAMGLGLGLEDKDYVVDIEFDDFRNLPDMEEAWSEAKMVGMGIDQELAHAVDEESARAPGFSLAMVEDPEPSFPNPATPPKRALQGKVGAEGQTPVRKAKRRRVGEESKSGAVDSKPELRATGYDLQTVLHG